MSAKKSALGRGFESLLPTELFDEEFDPTNQQDEQISQLLELELDKIVVDPGQPRKNFDEGALQQLADSIKIHGVLQPIVVIKQGDKYQIVAGERRWRASKVADKTTIPAIVRKLSDQNRLELSLIENIQRRNLSVIEIATSYLKLRDQFNLTLAQIGERVGGKTISTVSNTLRLLRLPKAIVEALDQGRLTEGQARPLVDLDNELAVKLAETIEKQGYSSRQVEQMVQKIKHQPEAKTKTIKENLKLIDAAKRLSDRLQTKVIIRQSSNPKKTSGKIEISYKTIDEFERIKRLLEDN